MLGAGKLAAGMKPPSGSKPYPSSSGGITSQLSSTSGAGGNRREDSDAKIEMLKNVKIFLTDKVRQGEIQNKTLLNDIEILNNCIRVEKSVHARTKL